MYGGQWTAQPAQGQFRQAMAQAAGGTGMDAMFEAASQQTGVPVQLLKAVAKAESNFNPDAVSSCGAVGVMQLMPATARSLGLTDPTDPGQNILGGAKYLQSMLERYDGDTALALAAYNAGPGNVDKYGGIPPFRETQNYVQKVMGYLEQPLQTPNGKSVTFEESNALSQVVQGLYPNYDVDQENAARLHLAFQMMTQAQMNKALAQVEDGKDYLADTTI